MNNEIYLIPSFADGVNKTKKSTTCTNTYQVELWVVNTETLEFELLNMASNSNEDNPDWLIKTQFIYDILKEKYNQFGKGEKIQIYGYDMFMRNLVKRLNDILRKVYCKPIKEKYNQLGAKEFVKYLVDKFAVLDKRNISTPAVMQFIEWLLPVIINSTFKEIEFHSIPKNGAIYKKIPFKNSIEPIKEYTPLENLMYEIQHRLVNRTHAQISEKLNKSKSQINIDIRNKFADRKNKLI